MWRDPLTRAFASVHILVPTFQVQCSQPTIDSPRMASSHILVRNDGEGPSTRHTILGLSLRTTAQESAIG